VGEPNPCQKPIFEIDPEPELDQKTIDQLRGISANQLLAEVRRRLARHPENSFNNQLIQLKVNG